MVRFKESRRFLCPDFLLLRFEVVIVNMAKVVLYHFFFTAMLPWDSWKYIPIRSTYPPSRHWELSFHFRNVSIVSDSPGGKPGCYASR